MGCGNMACVGGLLGTLHRKRLSFMGLAEYVKSLRVQTKSEYKGIRVVQRGSLWQRRG